MNYDPLYNIFKKTYKEKRKNKTDKQKIAYLLLQIKKMCSETTRQININSRIYREMGSLKSDQRDIGRLLKSFIDEYEDPT